MIKFTKNNRGRYLAWCQSVAESRWLPTKEEALIDLCEVLATKLEEVKL